MGRRRQEQVTGKTYEERVAASQKFSIRRFFKKVFRLNKEAPKLYANSSRSGVARVNPKLMGNRDE